MKIVWMLSPLAVFGFWAMNRDLHGFDSGASATSGTAITYCEQTIKQCKIDGLTYDCLLTNDTSVAIDPSSVLHVWYYDDNGVVLGDRLISSSAAYPGQTVHIQFIADEKAASAKICSIDPNSSLGKGLPFKRAS